LHPERVKSQQGTLEYRFSKADLETFKAQEALDADETGQDGTERTDQTGQQESIKKTEFSETQENKEVLEETRQDTPEQTRPDRTRETGQDNEVITLLKETTGLLKDQLQKKDEQIKDLGGKIDQLIERDRETNILIGQLQSKVLMLGQPKEPIKDETDQTGHTPEETRQDKADQTGQDKPVKKGFIDKVKDFINKR